MSRGHWRRIALGLVLLASQDAVERARELWEGGERRESVALLAAELEARQSAALALELARLELEIHRYEAALARLEGLPVEGARALRGRALFLLGRYEEALAQLEASDAGDAGDARLRVHALARLGRLAESDRELAALRARSPADDLELLVLEGQRLARGDELEAAAEVFRAVLARDRWQAAALFGLGRALVRAGEREAGLALLEEHRRIAPLLDRLDFLRRGVDLDPRHAPGHMAVGDLERELGRVAEAQRAYETAWRCAEGEELVLCALRRARLEFEDRADLEAALERLARGLERRADARLHVRAGDLLLGVGRFEEAVARYRAAATLRPDDPAVRERVRRAEAYVEGGR